MGLHDPYATPVLPSRIIQMYAMREETGALAPVKMDLNKVSTINKGTVKCG